MSHPLPKGVERISQKMLEGKIAKMLALPEAHVKRVVDTLIFLMSLEIENRRDLVITFYNWGRFRMYRRKCWNFATRLKDEKWVVKFTLSGSLRRRIFHGETQLKIAKLKTQ